MMWGLESGSRPFTYDIANDSRKVRTHLPDSSNWRLLREFCDFWFSKMNTLLRDLHPSFVSWAHLVPYHSADSNVEANKPTNRASTSPQRSPVILDQNCDGTVLIKVDPRRTLGFTAQSFLTVQLRGL